MKSKDPYDFIHKLYFKKGVTAYCLKESKYPITFKAIKSHFGQIYRGYMEQSAKRSERFKDSYLKGTAPTRDEISTYFLDEEEWNAVTKELGATLEWSKPFHVETAINQSEVLTIYFISPNRPFFRYKQKQQE